jgi:hypothetical protein
MRIEIKLFNDRVSFIPSIHFMAAKPPRAVARSGRVRWRLTRPPELRGVRKSF